MLSNKTELRDCGACHDTRNHKSTKSVNKLAHNLSKQRKHWRGDEKKNWPTSLGRFNEVG